MLFYGKVFIQELWKEGLTWDEPLPEMLHNRWNGVLKKLKLISQLKIPRFIGHVSDTCNYELVVFCDASKRAYATVIYLRAEYQDNVKVNVVFSKLRLVLIDTENSKKPKKEITLPHLELLAVTIGVRAANFVTRELKIPSLKRTIWTDSTCVLYWLRTNKPLSLFVDNRMKEIQRQGDLFYYVPSGENPADFPTRELTVPEIEQSRLWWNGPEWLMSSRDSWPKWQPPQPVLQDVEAETKTGRVLYECSNVVTHGKQDEKLSVCGLDETKYSTLRKLLSDLERDYWKDTCFVDYLD